MYNNFFLPDWHVAGYMAGGGKDHESAESYFKNIEEQTGTLILWPSKLKIGAKSKKGV